MTKATIVEGDNVGKVLDRALDAGEGLLRLTPTWVPRSFLHPGKRISCTLMITMPMGPIVGE